MAHAPLVPDLEPEPPEPLGPGTPVPPGRAGGPDAGFVSTGSLPSREDVADLLQVAHERYRYVRDGDVADYIPVLAEADPEAFGICVAGTTGVTEAVGHADVAFSIQSVSKPFVFALVLDAIGPTEAADLLGVDATGLPFDSVMAIELRAERTTNPMVNAGAIAATSLVPGAGAEERWEAVRTGLSRFAGRDLVLDERVYESEAATNQRNEGIAHLLHAYGRLYTDPDEATDVYTRQCSLLVTARDLALMGATLADGGVHPLTGEQVVSATTCKRVLAVMATAGLYERSGEFLYEVGLPGKSGVSGAVLTVAPGKGALATWSPRLDNAGNSVRGLLATRFLSQRLGLNLFASAPRPSA